MLTGWLAVKRSILWESTAWSDWPRQRRPSRLVPLRGVAWQERETENTTRGKTCIRDRNLHVKRRKKPAAGHSRCCRVSVPDSPGRTAQRSEVLRCLVQHLVEDCLRSTGGRLAGPLDAFRVGSSSLVLRDGHVNAHELFQWMIVVRGDTYVPQLSSRSGNEGKMN